jgi:hypothetical protein
MNPFVILALAAAITLCRPPQDNQEKVVVPLDGPALPDTIVQHSVDVSLEQAGPQRGLKVHYQAADWPNVFFRPISGVWDWSGYAGIAIDIYNPESQALGVDMRVDNAGADGVSNCNSAVTIAKAGAWTTFRLRFNRGGDKALWGMRGQPVYGPQGGGPTLDMKRIVAFQVFMDHPGHEHTLFLNNIRLYGGGTEAAEHVTYPFVDRFGQYRNATWPGKLKSAEELTQRTHEEQAELATHPTLPGRDRFGGWADGPKQKATGWFRTEEIDGRWWLVTPDGSLFFSTGIDCVGEGEFTFIADRDKWFEWLPSGSDPAAQLITTYEGAHSMAEPINGKGRVFSFYLSNLIRKFGDSWRSKWIEESAARMHRWGFNTLGNWSEGDFMERARIPFVVSGGIGSNVRRIEGGGGYWGKMVDAYDPSFTTVAEQSLGASARQYHSDPYCIGYFSDNEIAWEAVERGTLASPPGQPCRVAEVEMLKQKYGSLDKLAAAWGVNAASWDMLRAPEKPNAACQADLNAFVYQFAKRYFEVCKAAIRKAAPHQLYLGCRFATAPPPAVRACADVADVVSFNIYRTAVDKAAYTGANDLGKPLLIGEFHFGALDRGMFHEGLVPTGSQAERAAAYLAYVRSVADCPNFVGCHWFQYVDEPITGRWYDGENYNIGLVDVTDTPYPELVSAAKEANSEVYARHAASTN